MRHLLFLFLFLTSSVAFAQQGGTFQYIKLLPTTLTSTCSRGDLRFDTSAGYLNVCSTANNWTAFTLSSASLITSLPALTSASSLASVGTITSGTWSGSTVAVNKGGTGVTAVTTSPAATTFAGWDANKNLNANNFIPLSQSIATAGGTTTLTVASPKLNAFTGTTTQTVVLPAVSTLALGTEFVIENTSTGVVTVQSSGANTIQALAANTMGVFTNNAVTGTTAAVWSFIYSSNTAFSGLTQYGIMYANTTTSIASIGAGTSGQVLKSTGTSAPTWGSTGSLTYLAKTGSYTLAPTDGAVYWDTSGGVGTATLPTAVGNSGTVLQIGLSNGGNILTINTTSAQTIGGEASGAWKMGTKKDFMSVISDGANWQVLSQSISSCVSYTSVSNDSFTAGSVYAYGSKVYDPLGLYNTTNGKLTANVAGKWSINASMYASTTAVYLYVYLNATNVKQGSNPGSTANAAALNYIVGMNASDYFTIVTDQNGNTSGGTTLTTFTACRVAD